MPAVIPSTTLITNPLYTPCCGLPLSRTTTTKLKLSRPPRLSLQHSVVIQRDPRRQRATRTLHCSTGT